MSEFEACGIAHTHSGIGFLFYVLARLTQERLDVVVDIYVLLSV